MGDIVASSSHATEIKKRFPNCEVHLLTMAHMESIAKRIPKIDKLILVPNKFKFQDMRQFLIAFLQVLGNKYDLAFNFHRNWLINLFLRFALVKRSYGFSSKINNFLLSKSLEFDIYKNRTLQEVDLLNLSGIRIKSPSSLQIQNIDKRFELGSVQHYYCISLGGGNYFSEAKNRIWPVGKYVELAKKLDGNCILLGKGENDQLLAKSFQDSYPNKKLINLVDELNIDQTIGILAKAKFFVGNDSGLSYISASLKIPTFIVFGPTPCSSAKAARGKCNSNYRQISLFALLQSA